MKIIRCLLLASLLAPFLHAAEGSRVSYSSGSETVSAKWLTPEGGGPFPAVILIHEWWGLNEWVEKRAEELVKEGFAVLAVDLYRGHAATSQAEAHELMRGLPHDRVLRDLAAAMDYIGQQPSAKGKKIGVVGWCMGGGFALDLAVARKDLAACAVFYGSMPTDKEALEKINCPVAGFFGAEDRGISVQNVKQFEQDMLALDKKVSVKIYERAGHAFMNNTRPSYNEAAARDAWKRCQTFLSNSLK